MDQNYRRIEKAIHFLNEKYKDRPSLEDAAQHVHLSKYHFQRMFTEWAGVSPKKFLQLISTEHAKKLLKEGVSIDEASGRTGLSSASRLHDHFVAIEAMTPGEYREGGSGLNIRFSIRETLFGRVAVASTHRGICSVSFVDDQEDPVESIRSRFPNAFISHSEEGVHKKVEEAVNMGSTGGEKLTLHLRGTAFQLKVWQALLEIPPGMLSTYSEVAQAAGHSRASRAAGSAIGQNPVAYIIPCHRVIRSTGVIGNYRWGSDRKIAMIGMEQASKTATSKEETEAQ